jgi:ribosome recycling factor
VVNDIYQDADSRMKKSIEVTKQDLAKIRTGRAMPALLEHVMVEYYGSTVPVSQAATVGVADARTLTIQPWEKNMFPVIEKAILESDLGLNPVTAGDVMRIPLPPLTEERRIEMTKLVKQEGESGKVAVRNIRRDAIHNNRELLKEKEISEDDEKRAEQRLQLLTDKCIVLIDEIVNQKETEILEV